MLDPFGPEVCKRTGRLLTEWFETDEPDAEIERERARVALGLPEGWKPQSKVLFKIEDPEEREITAKFYALSTRRARLGYKYFMSRHEIAHRLNEASKIVSPENQKFLPPDVQERTGLELNPLWQLELLVRSGTLTPKEQVAALKELAQYTHSKAPSLNQNTNINLRPEDFLLELAKEEYAEVVGEVENQREQPREKMLAKHAHQARMRRTTLEATYQHQAIEVDKMMNEYPEGDLEISDVELAEILKDDPHDDTED